MCIRDSFSEDLRCCGAWDTTCGHKAKDITPSITWRREALKEEVLDDLPWKDERGPSSIRQTLEPFKRQHWGNFWETEWNTYMGFSKCIDTVLNWTELYNVVFLYNEWLVITGHMVALTRSKEDLTWSQTRWALPDNVIQSSVTKYSLILPV